LTESSFLPFTSSWKDRSRIIRYARDLCGTAAKGDIFRFLGKLCLMSSHFTSTECSIEAFDSSTGLVDRLFSSYARRVPSITESF
jgi:hypothetical protein